MVRQFVLHIKIALDNVPVQSAPNVIAIPSMSAPVFGVFFVGKSFPITNAQGFVSVDQSHWVLDVIGTVTPNFTDLKEVSLFLLQPNSLPADMGLALYVSLGGTDWAYRGFVSNSHPTEVMPLQWPQPPALGGPPPAPAAGYAQIGVSLESLQELSEKEGSKLGAKEDFAKMVGLDLFNFMQSFGGVSQVGGDKLLVPANILDRWYERLSTRLRKDPDFLTRQKDRV